MLAELVHGGGCDEDGTSNALAKLSGALSHSFGQEQRLSRPADCAGPSSSALTGPSDALLPPPSAEEEAFLHAFAAQTQIHDLEHMVPQMDHPAAAEMAWREAGATAGASRGRIPLVNSPGLVSTPSWHQDIQKLPTPVRNEVQAAAGEVVREALQASSLAGPGHASNLLSDPHRWDSLRSLGLTPQQMATTIRRADRLLAQIQPQAVPEPSWRARQNVDHFAAPGLRSPTTAPVAARHHGPMQENRAAAVDFTAPHTAADTKPAENEDAAQTSTSQAIWTPAGGDMVAEMEAAWAAAGGATMTTRSPGSAAAAALTGLRENLASSSEALTVAGGSSHLAELEEAWSALDLGGDGGLVGMDRLWESLRQQADGDASEDAAFKSAWEAATYQGIDEYTFRENNPYIGQAGLLAHGSALFERGELGEAILALEAAVQANPEDSVAWQILGQAHADADDDTRVGSLAALSLPPSEDSLLS